MWRITRHTWVSHRMDRAQESQSTGELILSVPNCIYWPCLAPPNPGLWWCINSCDWLFTRHLLAGVNITRQIPPITLITPLPGLCHCQQQSQMTHRPRLRWSCFPFSCISHCYMAIRLPPQPAQQWGGDEKLNVNKEQRITGVKDNGRRIVGSNALVECVIPQKQFSPHKASNWSQVT